MPTCLKALLVLGFLASSIIAAPPDAAAADLALTPAKKSHPKRLRVVRDYDGTPIMLRRAHPIVVRGYNGAALAHHHLYEAIPVPRAIPARYLNGQPVRPTDRILYARLRLR
jgi:hypothetical protein